MRVRARDRIVITVLLAAAFGARLAWHRLGPWVSLGIVFAAALVVIAIYTARSAGPRRGAPSEETAAQGPLLVRQD